MLTEQSKHPQAFAGHVLPVEFNAAINTSANERPIGLIDAWLETNAGKPHRFFFLGAIDRGAQSREVLEIVQQLQTAGAVCLFGNHEELMLGRNPFPDEAGSPPLRRGLEWPEENPMGATHSKISKLRENDRPSVQPLCRMPSCLPQTRFRTTKTLSGRSKTRLREGARATFD